MTTVAIIQARMGSSRLPGKVLMDIGGRSMLERVVIRARAARLVNSIVVATTTEAQDDVIIDLCKRIDTPWFRGSEDDVLDRYHHAASAFRADSIVRITSDCPLIDPSVIDKVVGAFHDAAPDYASNSIERTYPRGLDTEVFNRAALETAWRDASDSPSRIHVTPYLYLHPNRFNLLSVTNSTDASDLRWTVDTQLDLDVVRDIYRKGQNADDITWERALEFVRSEHRFLTRNHDIHQKTLEEG